MDFLCDRPYSSYFNFIAISDETLMIPNIFKHLKWAQGFNLSDYGDPLSFRQCCACSRPLHCIQVLSRPHGNVCLMSYYASIRQEYLIRKHPRPANSSLNLKTMSNSSLNVRNTINTVNTLKKSFKLQKKK